MFPAILGSRMLAKEMILEKLRTSGSKKADFLINIINNKELIIDESEDSIKNLPINEIQYFIGSYLKMINVEKDKSERSLLNISISSNDPLFSKNLLNSTIEKLQELVVELKLSLAQEKKDFIADRIFDIKTDLTKAEERLKKILEKKTGLSWILQLCY